MKIGKVICSSYKEIDDFLIAVAPNDSRILEAMTNKKYESVFRTFGYEYMDPDYRTVMTGNSRLIVRRR